MVQFLFSVHTKRSDGRLEKNQPAFTNFKWEDNTVTKTSTLFVLLVLIIS